MDKNNKGFTLTEVLAAFAVLCLAAAAVLPVFSRSGAHTRAAADGYQAQLYAQRLALWVKETLEAGGSPEGAAEFMEGQNYAYGYWVSGTREAYISPNAPAAGAEAVVEDGFPARVIITAVWTEDGRLAGRSAGMIDAAD